MRFAPIDNLLYLYLRFLKAVDRRKTGMEWFAPGEVKNILVVSSTAIGDTLLSTPAIRAVRRRYPSARIVALFNADNAALFDNSPYLDRVVLYHGGYKRFFATIRELKPFNFDLALILHGNEPQATPICYLAGARFIMKLPNNSAYNFLLANNAPVVAWDGLGHGIQARLATTALAGCDTTDVRMELFVNADSTTGVEAFLAKEGVGEKDLLIGFQPGASTISRQWFPDRFIELGKRLVDVYPSARLIITGSPNEAALCEGIAAGIGERAISIAGRLSLVELAPLIRRLQCLVTGDTGPMHIAITAGTPVVALYAVADYRRTGPLYDKGRHVVIQKPRTCDPCSSKKCKYQRCMEAITVDEVQAAVKTVLAHKGGSGA
ncbi:MAG: glycosyltransferase family 9 protein [Deltaproteobacteria bacterium]|nr:glycosyltransferase family 9 protein [Deltaproteobacteria bacterium]